MVPSFWVSSDQQSLFTSGHLSSRWFLDQMPDRYLVASPPPAVDGSIIVAEILVTWPIESHWVTSH